MVLVTPFYPSEMQASYQKALRKTVMKHDITYSNKYLVMTSPEAWHVVYRLKGALTKDKYRVHYKTPDGRCLVLAHSDSFDDILANWELLMGTLPSVIEDSDSSADPATLVIEAVQKFGLSEGGSGSRGSFRKPSASLRLAEQRRDFENRLRNLHSLDEDPHTLDDYAVSRTLGTGSFGRVLLSKDKSSGVFTAIKVIKKEVVVKLKQVEHTANEKNILLCVQCPFVIKMFCAMQDARNLYLVLEFINGGEMFTHIHKNRRFNYETSRFFSAEVVLAFEYLHNLDIVYRDLKPENLLIDSRGHVRITDFGFAKRVSDRTWTLCGTPEYLAPEIILSKGYAHAVDWWALGVLTYEMRCGHAPFYDASQMEMYRKIVEGRFTFPSSYKEDEKSFISALLTGDLTRRLGNLKSGTQDIRSHVYFKGINWDSMYGLKIQSPFIPKVSGKGDSSNFEKYEEEKITWVGNDVADPYADIFKNF